MEAIERLPQLGTLPFVNVVFLRCFRSLRIVAHKFLHRGYEECWLRVPATLAVVACRRPRMLGQGRDKVAQGHLHPRKPACCDDGGTVLKTFKFAAPPFSCVGLLSAVRMLHRPSVLENWAIMCVHAHISPLHFRLPP